jgi:site-specific recombinase XerD
MAEASLA